MNEECNTIKEEKCEEQVEMECHTVDKNACNTIKEEVRCILQKQNFIQFRLDLFASKWDFLPCSLVPDVVCRKVTQTRFDEKCWTVEEELCRTVYDTVWDKKCEGVNITVPQTECDTIQEMVMEMECKVVNETVKNPVCVTVIEQEVEEVGINMKLICI